MALLRARAIENQAFVVGVNRVGDGDGMAYTGDSQIIDPLGQIVANGGDRKVTITAEITAERVAEVRAQFPFLQDRR
jgi:predicted amidohydrolase